MERNRRNSHTAGVKNAGVFFSFLCLCLAAQAHSAHPPGPTHRCQLEPFPLPPPATGDKPAPDEKPAPDPQPAPDAQPGSDAPPETGQKPATDEPDASDDANQTPVPDAQTQDKADLDVADTLARVAPGGKMRVTVWAKNRGETPWTTKDVRIIVRWVDFETGNRRRWSYNWIKQAVPPMGQLRQSFDVPVPSRAGRYKVIYGLVRLPSGAKDGQAPPYNASQNKWPGEFAAVAFAVNVADTPATP